MEHERPGAARTRADSPGSGLGLAIAARAVRLHDGRIRAEKRPVADCEW